MGHRRAWEVAEKYGHCQHWIEPVGWHKWEHPATPQIKQRMWERRQDRIYIQEHRRREP